LNSKSLTKEPILAKSLTKEPILAKSLIKELILAKSLDQRKSNILKKMSDPIPFTILARASDGLILTGLMESNSSETPEFRQIQKILTRENNGSQNTSRLTIDTETGYYFAFMNENGVIYIALCEKTYPKGQAFKFLEELRKEFDIQYGPEVALASQPYNFIKFESFIQKTKKLYIDATKNDTQRNLSKVTKELSDVHNIMSKSISEILERGDRLDQVTKKSDELLASSISYEKAAKHLNDSMFWRTYGPFIGVGALIFLFLFWRFYY
jgi:vesicle transport protein SEC22